MAYLVITLVSVTSSLTLSTLGPKLSVKTDCSKALIQLNLLSSIQFSPTSSAKTCKKRNFQESVLIFLTKEQFHTYGCSVQFSCVQFFATSWMAAHQASLSITKSPRILKVMAIESVMPSNHLILCHPLLLPPSIFPSNRVFSNESVLHTT